MSRCPATRCGSVCCSRRHRHEARLRRRSDERVACRCALRSCPYWRSDIDRSDARRLSRPGRARGSTVAVPRARERRQRSQRCIGRSVAGRRTSEPMPSRAADRARRAQSAFRSAPTRGRARSRRARSTGHAIRAAGSRTVRAAGRNARRAAARGFDRHGIRRSARRCRRRRSMPAVDRAYRTFMRPRSRGRGPRRSGRGSRRSRRAPRRYRSAAPPTDRATFRRAL